MVTLLIISLVFLLFITGILFIPIQIAVDTKKKNYYITLPGYFRLDLLFGYDYAPRLKLKLFFLTFNISPSQRIKKKKDNYTKATVKRKDYYKKRQSVLSSVDMFSAFLKAFKVKRLNANIDTGDFPLNAQLMPIAQYMNNENINLSINFNNTNSVELLVVTQIYRLIKPGIRFLLLTK